MSRVTNSTHWWQKNALQKERKETKLRFFILLKSYNKYFSWYLQGVDRTDFPESDMIGSHISSDILHTFNFNLHKQLVTIWKWWNLVDLFRRKKELIVFQMNIYFLFFLLSHFWHLQSHSMEIWSIFVERRVWYWFRFHSCHIFFYNHILDIHNRILWYRFHSYHIYFYGTFCTFTIAFYVNLINLCPNSILIQIPLMSYSFLQSHFGHSQSHCMEI